ncbi:MAG: S26 family signal peptidase [Thermoplasmata archaeon]
MASPERKPSRIPKKYRPLVLFLRDAAVALAIVACVLVGMYAYTGLWPPIVVVESDSMMHSEENISHIGAIDTGDLVLKKKVDGVSDIRTYIDGYVSGYKTYGDYGDVIIYKRGGLDIYTPIIHRAMIYLEANPDGASYRSDSLKDAAGKWQASNPEDTWDHLTSMLTILHVGYRDQSVVIDIESIIESFSRTEQAVQSGFITKGDHNNQIDQMGGAGLRPVDIRWVEGKARGEIPWFGLLKLWFTGTLGSPAPENSVRNLWISLALIVIAPVLMDIVLTYLEKRGITKRRFERFSEDEEKNDVREKKTEAEDSTSTALEPPKQP